jgi:hypothetical protein
MVSILRLHKKMYYAFVNKMNSLIVFIIIYKQHVFKMMRMYMFTQNAVNVIFLSPVIISSINLADIRLHKTTKCFFVLKGLH